MQPAFCTNTRLKSMLKSEQPKIELQEEKLLVGIHLPMSIFNNQTPQLWKTFMPRRMEIKNQKSTVLFSMQIYGTQFFENFDPHREFTKWAATEVRDFSDIPAGMEGFTLVSGLYAVFPYQGDATDAEAAFRYIFQTWLPSSAFLLDNRPHFEILGDKYKPNNVDSEEDIWIPIRPK